MPWSLWEQGTWFASTNRYWAPNVCKALWNPKFYLFLHHLKSLSEGLGDYSEQTLCSAWLCQPWHQCLPSPGGPLRKRGCQEVLGTHGRMLMVTVSTEDLPERALNAKGQLLPGECHITSKAVGYPAVTKADYMWEVPLFNRNKHPGDLSTVMSAHRTWFFPSSWASRLSYSLWVRHGEGQLHCGCFYVSPQVELI